MSRVQILEASPAKVELQNLWQAYAVSRDNNLRNRLLLHYLPLSRMIARHVFGRVPQSIELQDLEQAATLGLRAAIGSYKPERGIPFENYCGPRVRGAVLDYLRALDWAPRMLRSRLQSLQEMTLQMEMETGQAPTDEELSSALRVPLGDIESLRKAGAPMRAPIHRSDCGDEMLEMMADDAAHDPQREAQRADLREFLSRGLSEIERQVIMLYYYDNLSLREIGKALQLCESRVSQIHQAVLGRLRERMHRIGGATIDD